MADLVSVEKVSKRFGDIHALRDVDLRVSAGEVVVVIGPSGSGKSALPEDLIAVQVDPGRRGT